MPRNSKSGRAIYTNHERSLMDYGTMQARLNTDAQLPFGYCPFNLNPIDECVISPSGHMYSREAILEYLLAKTREIKEQAEAFKNQEVIYIYLLFCFCVFIIFLVFACLCILI